jgi:septum formation protein
MKIILASKSGVRKKILEENGIEFDVVPSQVDEDMAKESLLNEGANPLLVSKNLAELKAIKVSKSNADQLVLGADSVISLNDKLISKPKSREEAFKIMDKLNGKIHYLISSVCFVKNGSMVWNYSERSELKMRKIDKSQITNYLNKIPVSTLLAYGVYQVEASGKELFEYIKGDENSIMGLPIKQIKQYIKNYK